MTVSDAANRAGTTGVALVRLLGPVRVVTPDGTVLGLPSATQRRLVAALALDARRPIRSERLAADLRMSPGSLRTSVSRLRKLLGAEVLRTDAAGYRLEADVDSELFYRALIRVDPAADRLDQLERALRWWHGPAIEEFRTELWARSESVRLTEMYAAAVEEHAAELMTRGRWPEAIAALKRHIAAYPLRDHPRGLLMQALTGSGRRAEALAVYRTAPAGIGPMTPAASAAFATRLPGERSSLVGRDDDLDTLAARIPTTRLLTLAGAGGVGKSQLAVALARRAQQAGRTTWFVDLAALRDPVDIVSSIAAVVGAPATDDVFSLARSLGERPGLLVIDSCEHVLDAVSEVVDTVTLRCPNIAVVATSREFLALEGEQIFHVRPLDPAGAGADLFQARRRAAEAGAEAGAGAGAGAEAGTEAGAGAVGTAVAGTERSVVAEICRRLDGIPLAIEIAAAWAGSLGLRGLRSSLDDAFTPLADGQRRGAERQQTLGHAIGWSYRRLSPEAQRVFRMLGVFRGGFELDAAADVAHRLGYASQEIPRLVSSLAARSMIDVNSEPVLARYRLLEPLRAFAVEALAEAGELAVAEAAQAQWIAGLTDVPLAALRSRASRDAAVRLERETGNWRAALDLAHDTADRDLAARLCGAATSALLLSHPQLARAVIRLDPLLARDDDRRVAVATAYGSRAISAFGHEGDEDMQAAQAVYAECDPRGVLGARQLLHGATRRRRVRPGARGTADRS